MLSARTVLEEKNNLNKFKVAIIGAAGKKAISSEKNQIILMNSFNRNLQTVQLIEQIYLNIQQNLKSNYLLRLFENNNSLKIEVKQLNEEKSSLTMRM